MSTDRPFEHTDEFALLEAALRLIRDIPVDDVPPTRGWPIQPPGTISPSARDQVVAALLHRHGLEEVVTTTVTRQLVAKKGA